MPIRALVYGLGVEVNLPIAALGALPEPEHIDVEIRMGALPSALAPGLTEPRQAWYVSPELNEDGEPNLRVSRLLETGDFHFEYDDGTRFQVDAAGTRVWATWNETATVEDTATYLLGPILGFLLRLRGITCLHASAVAVEGRAILLVGPAGAGKSTTAAAFAQLGYAVITDDVAALDEVGDAFLIRPAYPRVRLWPPSVTSLFGSPDALPRLTPTWEKRFLGLGRPGFAFQGEPLPLGAIYFLGPRSDDPLAPQVQPMTQGRGMMTLVSDTYTTRLLGRDLRALEFEVLGRLVASVPLRAVTPGQELARVGAMCTAILEDFARLLEPGA